ncbi:MAG: SDR family oxidoreductase [Bdellovibrionota bacterium]|nr:SDR family oxidoreductase [Bdellovibrionota bacterium]
MSKIALISGCSSGIGQGIAEALAAKSWVVYAGVRSEADFKRLDSLSENIYPIYLDVTKEEQISACFKNISEKHDKIDVLINNAGIATGAPIEASEMQVWRKLFDVNVFGLVALTKKTLPLIRNAKGRIINISSISGLVASPFMGTYAASKFAVEALSDSLRREVKDQGIHISLIEPGPIKTKIWDKAMIESKAAIDAYDSNIKDVYGKAIEKFKALIDNAVEEAVPVEEVTKVLLHACTSNSPKTRYMVSKNKNLIRIIRSLPDKLADKLILEVRK